MGGKILITLNNNYNSFIYLFIPTFQDPATKEKALQTMSTMSSAQIVSAMHTKGSIGLPPPPVSYPGAIGGFWQGAGPSQDVKPFAQTAFAGMSSETKPSPGSMGSLLQAAQPHPGVTGNPWEGRSIATPKLRLVEFSAFVEYQRDQDTVRLHLHLL